MQSFISAIAKMISKELQWAYVIVTQLHNSLYSKPFSFVYIELLEASSSCRRLKPNLLDTAKSHYKLTCAIDFLHPLAISYMAVPTYLLVPIVYRILFFFLNTVFDGKKKQLLLHAFVRFGYRTTWQFHFNLTLIIKVDKKLIGLTFFIFNWRVCDMAIEVCRHINDFIRKQL